MRVIVSYSGGKDSQACLIHAIEKYGADKITAVFCDTGWEHPETYKHIENTCKQLEVKLITLKSKFDFVSLAIHKKRFPSTQARFCTVELKVKPMIDYILSLDDSCIVIQGIRANESASRAAMEVECMYFKEYFTPNKRGKKSSYRGKDVREYCEKHDASVFRPIFTWSAQKVIDYILNSGQQPNPLYSRGFSRVGCFPCIMNTHLNTRLIGNDIIMKNRLIEAEKQVMKYPPTGSCFFPPGYIPKWACNNKNYATVEEVFNYLSNKNATLDIFEPGEGYSCMSMYFGLCE